MIRSFEFTGGMIVGAPSAVPMEVVPVSVGGKSKNRFNSYDKKLNDKGAFPNQDMRYKIECRLRIDKYPRLEAYDRCKEIHGTTFDGMFMSGSFYTFWSKV